MARSIAKWKDYIRSLGLEKEPNRELLDLVKELDLAHRKADEHKRQADNEAHEVARLRAEAEQRDAQIRSVEKELHRLQKHFAEYREEAEDSIAHVVAVIKQQWESTMRTDLFEPKWSLPDLTQTPPEQLKLRSDGTIDLELGRVFVYQDNWRIGSPPWVMFDRKNSVCELVEEEFVICQRSLPDWGVLHPDDRNRTVFAAYSIYRPARLLSSYDRENLLNRIGRGEYSWGGRSRVQVGDKSINIVLPTPVLRLNPAYFTNRVCRPDETAFVARLAHLE